MLTPAQLVTLGVAIDAETDAAFVALRGAGATGGMAEWFNQPSTFWVWKTRVTKADLVGAVGPDGTTFNWTGNGFITRSVGELTAWQEVDAGTGFVNPSLPNVRTAFGDIFSGTGNAAANRTHLLAVARRPATQGEKVFATGTGTTAAPGLLTFEGVIGDFDVVRALEA